MKSIDRSKVPEFKDFFDFCQWYMRNDGPLLPPDPWEYYELGTAVSAIVFRHKRYQVEMYLAKHGTYVPPHAHPGVHSIEHVFELRDPDMVTRDEIVWSGQKHGKAIENFCETRVGFIMYSIQEWLPGIEMTTISARWDGDMVNDLHLEMLRDLSPEVEVTGKHVYTPYTAALEVL